MWFYYIFMWCYRKPLFAEINIVGYNMFDTLHYIIEKYFIFTFHYSNLILHFHILRLVGEGSGLWTIYSPVVLICKIKFMNDSKQIGF